MEVGSSAHADCFQLIGVLVVSVLEIYICNAVGGSDYFCLHKLASSSTSSFRISTKMSLGLLLQSTLVEPCVATD